MINEREQLIRIVSGVGNGAHIFAPKEWINEKVLIVRLEKKNIKDAILEKIYPYLDKITAVFLYGSHSRKETNEFSDKDVLIIAKERFELKKEAGWDIAIIPQEKIQKAIELNPIMMYSLFKEAVPIINEHYLDELRKININKKYFKQFLDETQASLSSNKEILNLDRKTGKFASSSLVYSLFLRLRGLFIINCLLNKKDYSNSAFKKWILDNCNLNYEKIYQAYVSVRDNREIKENVLIIQAENLLAFLEKELKKIKD